MNRTTTLKYFLSLICMVLLLNSYADNTSLIRPNIDDEDFACGPPKLEALMVDACGNGSNGAGEFFIMTSGTGGFSASDISFDFDPDNNTIAGSNADIGAGCNLQGALGVFFYAGCSPTNFVENYSTVAEIPPGVIIVVLTSSASPTAPYNFGSLCSLGIPIYVFQSTCNRTIGAFSDGDRPAGVRTYSLSVNGSSSSISYNTSSISDDRGTYVLSGGGSGTACAAPPINISPPPPAPVLTYNEPCEGQTLILTATPAGADSYIWSTLTGTLTTATNELRINNVTSSATGLYSVSAVTECATSALSNQITVLITAGPSTAPTITSGTGDVCVGDILILIATPVVPGATYVWVDPEGNEVRTNTPTWQVTVTASLRNGGSYSVFAETTNCSSPIGFEDITILPAGSLNFARPTLCATDPVYDLNDLFLSEAAVGTWAGNGVSGTSFNPSGLSGAITINFTPIPGSCSLAGSTRITVDPASTTMINQNPDAICASAPSFDLSQLLTNQSLDGEWRVDGSINAGSFFDPNGLSGNIAITFSPDDLCASVAMTSIQVTAAPSIPNLVVTDAGCSIDDGTITITATGGTGIKTYLLNGTDEQNNNVFSDLATGDYLITVRDANGCEVSRNETVDGADTPQFIRVDMKSASCGEMNGSIFLEANRGAGNYLYSLNGGTRQANSLFENLSGGVYSIEVIDGSDCEYSESITLGGDPVPEILGIDMVAPSCGEDNGSLTVQTSGGQGQLTYTLNGTVEQTTSLFENLEEGNYTISIKDENDCSVDYENPISLVAASAVTIDNLEIRNAICGIPNGSVTITASGGSGDLSYSIDGAAFSSSNLVLNLSEGNYLISIQDETSCQIDSLVSIVEQESPVINNTTPTDATCSEDNGSILLDVTDGTGAISYSIDGLNFLPANPIEDLPSGNYTITIKDENECSAVSNAVTINNQAAPAIDNVTPSSTNCGGSTGSILVSASGGSGVLGYSLDGINFFSNNEFTNLSSGTYTITVRDENQCTSVFQNVIVSDSAGPSIDNVTPSSTNCGGSTGSVLVSASGGAGLLEYSIDGISFSVNNEFTSLSSGAYTITVRDENQCTSTFQNVIVSDSAGPSIDNVTPSSTNCGGSTGSILVSASGGAGLLEYSVDGLSFFANEEFTDLSSGTYTITVRDENQCTSTFQNVIVSDSAGPSIDNVTPSSTNCGGSTGSILVSASGGAGLLEYSVDGLSFFANEEFTDLSSGTYTITVRDENQCTSVFQNVIVSDSAGPSIDNVTPSSTNCGGSIGSVLVSASGGSGALEYSIDGISFSVNNEFTSLSSGTYTITVRDENQCTSTFQNVIVSDSAGPSIDNVIPNPSNCGENSGIIEIIASGGNGVLEYSINGVHYFLSNQFTDLPSGSYDISVRDENQCITSLQNIQLDDLAGMSIDDIQIIPTNCASASGSIVVTASGGSGELEYSLDGINFQSDNSFPGLAIANYTIIVRDENSCLISSDLINVGTLDQPSIDNIDSQNTSCGLSNGTITINASGGTGMLSYSLDGINFQNNNEFTNLASDNYIVTIKDENDCKKVSQVIVIESSTELVINTVSVDKVNCGANDGRINVGASGGTGLLEYSLDGVNFQLSSEFNNLSTGIYLISVRDENNCLVTDQDIKVENIDAPNINQISPSLSTCGKDDGQIIIDASGGTGVLEFSIDGINFQTNPQFDKLSAANYTITVRDGNNCSTSEIVTIDATATPIIDSVVPTAASCNGGDGRIEIMASGGTGTLSYSIDGINFQAANIFENISASTYTIVVSAGNSCTVESSMITIAMLEGLSFDVLTTVNTTCGDENGSLSISTMNATGTLQYSIDGGANFQTSNIFENLAAANYELVIQDETGCTDNQSINIAPSNPISVSNVITVFPTCGTSDGSIAISIAGVSGSLSYSLDGINFQTSNTFENLAAGNYTLFVEEENACMIQQNISISDVAGPIINNIAVTLANCGKSTGTIALTASGGSGTLSYSLDGNNFQTNSLFTNLPKGNYNIIVRDENACQSSQNVEIMASPELSVSCSNTKGVSMLGASDGGNTLTILGGTAPYTILWTGAVTNTVIHNEAGDFQISGLAAGGYVADIEDASGCKAMCIFVIEGGTCTDVVAMLDTMLCTGENFVVNNTRYDINNLTGSETFTGVANGCDSIININVEFLPALSGSIVNTDQTICKGDGVTLAFVLAGDQTYSIVVFDGNEQMRFDNIDENFVLELFPNKTTTYTLQELSGANSTCESIVNANEVNITVAELVAEIVTLSELDCSSEPEAVVTAMVTGGTAPYNFEWSTGDQTPEVQLNEEATYTLQITDANACSALLNYELLANPSFQIEYQIFPPSCLNQETGKLVFQQIEGGAGNIAYSLAGESFITIESLPLTVGKLKPGTYELTIEDVEGCSHISTVEIPNYEALEINFKNNPKILKGETINLFTRFNFTPATLKWSPSLGLDCDDCFNPNANPTLSTVYTLTATDESGCTVSKQINVFVETTRRVFIPNAFSPNDDGFNDLFIVEAAEEVVNIQSLQIFNRWGALVYEAKDFLPGLKDSGWDGRLNNQSLSSGVYLYSLLIEFDDGEILPFFGDVLLIRE